MEGPEAFQKLYRMEYVTFMKLCDIIRPKIIVNDEMARVRTGREAITVEIMLHCLSRWLSSGSYLHIRFSAGISPAKFNSCVYKCIDAILESEDLAKNFQALRRNWINLHRVLSH